jgi:hypothetical protein
LINDKQQVAEPSLSSPCLCYIGAIMQSSSEMGDHINPREGTVQIVEDEEVSVPEAIEEGPAHGDVDGRNEADNHEENKEVQDKNTKILHSQESLHERSFHPGEVVLYAAPQQRQKWGETQVRPRINWGDTFYDLFFVAAVSDINCLWHLEFTNE